MLYMPKYRYIVVSTELADLVVYKWDQSAQIVTDFKGNIKPIRSLSRHEHRVNQFLTASVDSTIRIWCLEVSEIIADKNRESVFKWLD